jgi:hypothetical protein
MGLTLVEWDLADEKLRYVKPSHQARDYQTSLSAHKNSLRRLAGKVMIGLKSSDKSAGAREDDID